MPPTNLRDAIEALLGDPSVGWSVGRSGALAEFYWTATEAITRAPLTLLTARGAFRVEPQNDMRLFAGESLGHSKDSWSQWIAIAIPQDRAPMCGASGITD